MIKVEFHHNAQDRLLAACELIASKVAGGQRVAVFAPDDSRAEAIDRALWTFSALSFVPHCREGSPLAPASPVVIGRSLAEPADVLVNFSDSLPETLEHHATLIEVVGQDAAERASARERFKYYRERGCPLSTHDLNEARHGG